MKGSATGEFLRRTRKKRLLFFLLTAATATGAMYAVSQGNYTVPLVKLFASIVGRADAASTVVVWKIRLPRVAASLVVGWGLALAGLFIQTLLRNPLGSPSTLGISQGAAFGASVAIIILGAKLFSVTLFAFAGSVGATLIILLLNRLKSLSAEAVILAGVALSSLFGAGTVLVQYLADETQLALAVVWTFGDVARSNWREIGFVAAATAATAVYGFCHRWDFNALDSGEEAAKGLGVPVERLRFQGMAAALVSALATAFHGVIAFVGLVAPHMARRLVGSDQRFLLPVSGALGALLLLAADTCTRQILGSGAFPVGIMTSFLGAPLFLYLLVRGWR